MVLVGLLLFKRFLFVCSIVRERQEKQANFQLILITHDEEFMEQLHRNGLGRTYYRVGKSDRGHSEITQQTA
eukprot:m.70430 g.70430  ORF g.70430 m.70430 type:complete len:72 (-) comp12259_c0_seq3:731-946(-)